MTYSSAYVNLEQESGILFTADHQPFFFGINSKQNGDINIPKGIKNNIIGSIGNPNFIQDDQFHAGIITSGFGQYFDDAKGDLSSNDNLCLVRTTDININALKNEVYVFYDLDLPQDEYFHANQLFKLITCMKGLDNELILRNKGNSTDYLYFPYHNDFEDRLIEFSKLNIVPQLKSSSNNVELYPLWLSLLTLFTGAEPYYIGILQNHRTNPEMPITQIRIGF